MTARNARTAVGIVTRGVLYDIARLKGARYLDIARLKGARYLEPGQPIPNAPVNAIAIF